MKYVMMFGWLLSSSLALADWVNLWPNQAPGAPEPKAGAEKINEGMRYTDIEKPQYFLYPAPQKGANQPAVVIFPGGGYTILAMDHEGHAYAKWLNERGITAVVVKYRVSGNDAFSYRYPVPFLDARRAIRTVRFHAKEWGIDPAKVGVMGSSAGGHLASLCATRFEDRFTEETGDEIDKLSCRPDFSILIYPVISLEPTVGHGGSARRLLGATPEKGLAAKLSTQQAVSGKTAPVFLLSTFDDGVDCRNSLSFASSCREHKVPVSLHLFERGGHGYGMNGKGDLSQWPTLLDAWLKSQLSLGKNTSD